MAEFDQWLTPPGVAEAFLEWSAVRHDDIVIEPAAGEGALIPGDGSGVIAFEIDPERVAELQYWKPKTSVVCCDFLKVPPPPEPIADVCLENPPYSEDGEGTFIRQGLLWAPRCCGLLRAGSLQGAGRWEKCWRHVRPTRIASLIHRPHFEGIYGSTTKWTPQYDFIAVECVLRDEPLERWERHVDKVEFSWVFWR